MDTEVSTGRLRARATADKRPMAGLPNKERGLRAATEVLNGTMSVPVAMESYLVVYDTVCYYKKKLLAQGLEDKSTPREEIQPRNSSGG